MTTLKVHLIAFAGAAFVLLAAGYFAILVYEWQKQEKRKLDKWRREQEWMDENSYS